MREVHPRLFMWALNAIACILIGGRQREFWDRYIGGEGSVKTTDKDMATSHRMLTAN